MSGPIRIIGLALIGGFFILAGAIFYTVHEDQQAIVLQFGAPVGGATNPPGRDEAGLKVKLPWQNVIYFDRRNLEFDLPRSLEIIVANEERLLVDGFVRYRITNPLLYFQTLGGGGAGSARIMKDNFNNRLTNVTSESMRQVLGAVQIRDIITTRRAELMRDIQDAVTEEALKLGVSIIDVRIRQADFPQENARNVYQRMSSDYAQQAERIRAEGDRRAREVRAQASKEREQILANANQESAEIRGRADATANCIFAGAYQGVPVVIEDIIPEEPTPLAEGEVVPAGDSLEAPRFTSANSEALGRSQQVTCRFTDPSAKGDAERAEFFAFYRSLDAYRRSLTDEGTTIILSPDSEFFRYFNGEGSGVR